MSEEELETLVDVDADEYIILFSLEFDLEECRPVLGGFLRIPKLPIFMAPPADLHVADELSGRAITRTLKAADDFLNYTRLRGRMDNKCRGPFVVHTEVKLDRGAFTSYIDSLRPMDIIERYINNPAARALTKAEMATTRSTLLKRGLRLGRGEEESTPRISY